MPLKNSSRVLLALALPALAGSALAQAPERQDAPAVRQPAGKQGALRGRLEGDAAMAGRDYAVAASFYGEYKAAALASGDRAALKDACERLVDALILAKLPDLAAKAVADFEEAFPSLDADSLAMWKADVLILKGRPLEAANVVSPVLGRLPNHDPRRLRVLSTLAISLEGAGDLARAAEVYSSIEEEALEGSSFRRGAFVREVFCLAASGQVQAAKERLQSTPSPKGKAAVDELRLLNVFMLLKESGPYAAATAYSQLRLELKEGPNSLAYNIAMSYGDAWLRENSVAKALDCYREAFAFSPGRLESCESLKRIMTCLNTLGRRSEAADLAMKHLDMFKGAGAHGDMKLQAARLLASAGRLSDAVALYSELASDSTQPSDIRDLSARECARAQVDLKDYDGAAATVKSFYGRLPDQGEGPFLLAEILAKSRRPAEAGDAFMNVASKWSSWREKALYEAMRCYIDAKLQDKALEASNQIISSFEGSEVRKEAFYFRAGIYELAGDLDKASEEFLKFADSYPNHPDLAPKALYRSARICYLKGRLADAASRFSELMRKYPSNPLSSNAAYWRINAFYGLGDELSAERETRLLVERQPDSEFSFAALFRLAVNCSDSGLPEKADAILNEIAAMEKASPEIKARALFEKAAIAFKAGAHDKAFMILGQLYERYPDSSYVSDGLFLHGDILKDRGDYSQASSFYRKAMERRPNSLLEASCQGALADCLFCLGAPTKDKPQLEQALEIYRAIVARREAPASFRNMALYKSGRCLELLDDLQGALENYKSLIYRFQVSARLGELPDSIWAVKAANSIVGICRRRAEPEDYQSASDALQWLLKSGLEPAQEVKARIEELDKMKFKP